MSETKKYLEKVKKDKKSSSQIPTVENGGQNNTESYEFQSEVQQLLNILVYSLYQNKEVFLRELISNSIDALNKVEFELLTNPNIEDKDLDLKINILVDSPNKKITIEDTGIGMSKDELIKNIGTIAHSGTLDFLKKINESDANRKIDLIGQFGVGFYSSFMVAEKIYIYTKSYIKGSKGYLWKSENGNNYTIEETAKDQRGTRIELFIKDDEKKFLEKWNLKNIINKHSKFVPFPIYLDSEKIDSVAAIWTQPKSNLKEKDYNDFYKFFQNSPDDPETYIHLLSDAPVQFNSILYIPKSNSEIYGFIKTEPGVDLYSRKILIQKSCRDIIPEYFRFVKGVVDSEDIPLNISRETIQNDIKISKIRKNLLKRLFDHLHDIKSKDRDKYLKIWHNFARNLKEGIPNEYEFQERLASLLLFNSSKTPKDQHTDLEEYVSRMTEEQLEIYYIFGNDHESIERNPALEVFKKKDIEVLIFTDPMDVWVTDHMKTFKNKIFRPVEGADIKIDEKDDKEESKEILRETENFVSYLKTIFGNKINDIRISKRLVESPCILVNSPSAHNTQLERMLRIKNTKADFSNKILEINPKNKLISEMMRIHKEKPDAEMLKTLSFLLLDNMILREGVLENVELIIDRTQDIMYLASQK